MVNDNLIKLSFEEVLYKHQKLVEKLVWLLRNSETVDSEYPLDEISWIYSFVFRREEIIYDADLYEKILKMNAQERLEEELKHIDVSFCMVTPSFSILTRLTEIPKEVREFFKKSVEQRMYVERFFGFSKMEKNSSVSYPMKMDIWDESELPLEDLKKRLQEAIEVENYEEAAKIQKQIDSKL